MREDFGESMTSIPLTPARFSLRSEQVFFNEGQLLDPDYETPSAMIGLESGLI
jgi:hypothetical protein